MKSLLHLHMFPNRGVIVFIQNKQQPLFSIGKVCVNFPDAAEEESTCEGG